MVLVRVGQLEGYWSLLAASQILLGIRDSGYSEVPQGAGEMLRYTLGYMPKANVAACATCVNALCGLLDANDPRLQTVVQRYAQVAESHSQNGRQWIVRELSRIEYPDIALVDRLRDMDQAKSVSEQGPG